MIFPQDRVVYEHLNTSFTQLDAMLTELTHEQAGYIGVPVEGPYKPDTYRY